MRPSSDSRMNTDTEARAVSMRFRDFDEFSERNGLLDIDFLQLDAGPVDQRLLRVSLDRMVLMRGWESTSYLTRSSTPTGYVSFLFPLVSVGVSLWRGREVNQQSLLSYQGGGDHVGRISGGLHWATIFFQVDAFRDASLALRGVVPAFHPTRAPFLQPGAGALDALRAAVRQAFHVAESTPQLLDVASVRRSLEETILNAGIGAIDPPNERVAPEGPLTSHHRVVSLAEEVLAAKIDSPIYLSDLCSATGVSERTVRNAFQSLYHVSPIRFLHLRRMHQVRRALRNNPGASVTDAALRFGFGNLGRFAVEYRQIFGESPSHTLRSAFR
jgi:AraC family transcriptional regulator, ethanolamine operon transcriptional activator